MILKTNKFDMITTWLYLEQKVNKGSPSGFGGENSAYNVQQRYNPFCDCRPFQLSFINDESIENIGCISDLLSCNDILDLLFVHPGMVNLVKNSLHKIIEESGISVVPTASSRTVYAKNVFLKLHYDGLIGRVNRSISKQQAIASVELSKILQRAVDTHIMPPEFYFMREPYAKSIELTPGYTFSCVFRDLKPYPFNDNMKWIIPIFSLFSKDKENPNDDYILKQLIDISGVSPEAFVLKKIVTPLLECYFSAIIKCGLQFEIQAQNSLIALDGDFNVIGVIFRDLESVDKDLQIIINNNLTLYDNEKEMKKLFKSFPYKCIWYDYRPEQPNSYQKKHSFMFDFKLGEYVLSELVAFCVNEYGLSEAKLNDEIKHSSSMFTQQLPNDFFPNDCWYYYDNIVLDRKEDNRGKVFLKPFKERTDIKYR